VILSLDPKNFMFINYKRFPTIKKKNEIYQNPKEPQDCGWDWERH